jgi:phage tail sheath protein FI
MGFLVSPGVEVKEIDLTDIIPAQSTSIGGYTGHFRWGPIGEIVTISSEKELARIFGAPSTENAALERSFLEAASFLKYSNNLKVVRANATGSLNAYSSQGNDSPESAGFTISSITELETNQAALNALDAHIVARYAGVLGNSLRVHVVTEANYGDQPASVKNSLQFKPGTTAWAEALTGEENGTNSPETGVKDELAIVIVDNGGQFSGVKGEILEVHEGLSIARNAKNQFGESNYWADFVNTNSSLIFGVKDTGTDVELTAVSTAADTNLTWLDTDSNDDSPGVVSRDIYVDLGGGADATSFTNDVVVTALELFEDSETTDVNFLFAFEDGAGTTDTKIKTIADQRRDVIGFISAPLSVKDQTSDDTKKDTITEYFDGINSSSYIVFDSGPAYVYNKYRDAFAFIQLHGHIAGLCAATDDLTDPWFSPAGLNRGQLRGITRLAYNPKKADRDELYQKRINPVVTLPGQGTVLFGDKTALTKPSAFDRINVRRLFITIEKAIATASKFQLFELNDAFTRSTFRNAIEPFLRDVQGRRGITDFRVVCDDSNNTQEVIDGNRFVADIYIKPTRSINYVTLNFIATRTGASFEELIGR